MTLLTTQITQMQAQHHKETLELQGKVQSLEQKYQLALQRGDQFGIVVE
jgi:hypothetical protein